MKLALLQKNKYLPMTVMLNWLDPSFSAVSLALQVTVVMPTGYLPLETTTLPAWSSHIMLAVGINPSKASSADGGGDQTMAASGLPVSTFIMGTLFGVVMTGGSMSVTSKRSNQTCVKWNMYINGNVGQPASKSMQQPSCKSSENTFRHLVFILTWNLGKNTCMFS